MKIVSTRCEMDESKFFLKKFEFLKAFSGRNFGPTPKLNSWPHITVVVVQRYALPKAGGPFCSDLFALATGRGPSLYREQKFFVKFLSLAILVHTSDNPRHF